MLWLCLVVRGGSCKRATLCIISCEQALYLMMSESGTNVAEEGNAEPGRDKLSKGIYEEDERGKLIFCVLSLRVHPA